MKAKIITLITLILMGGMNLYAQNRRTLIAYFSWSGNTQHVAEYIAGQTGGTLFRIDPVKPYPTDYKPCTEVAKKEKECKRIEKKARKHERYSQKLTREYNIKYNANIQL